MMRLTNLTGADIRLPTGHMIPRNGSVDLPRSVVAYIDNQNFLAGLERSRRVRTGAAKPKAPSAVFDPDGGPYSRIGIAAANRSQLLGIAEAHGVEPDVVRDMGEDRLREFIADLLFVSL